ncbi:hypothetical protein R6Q59_009829 [Mikania micrantha]
MTTNTLTSKSTLPLSHPSNAAIPILGFGTCASQTCTYSALTALESGYRHLDTAQIYHNESETGAAITQSQIPPSSLYICSKLWEDQYTRAGALESVRNSCKKLNVPCLDLYLLHVPRPGPEARYQAWLGLQDAQREGLVKTLGVSNWASRHVEMLMEREGVEVFPAVNQVEFHPWQQQREIVEWCKAKGVVVVAYSPLTQGRRLGDPVVKQVCERVGRTPAQVVLRWCLQKGIVVIPKSDKKERIVENMKLFDFELGKEEMEMLDRLDEGQKGNVGEWDPFAWE